MAEPVIVNTTKESDSGNGISFLIGIIILVVCAFLFIFYGLPLVRSYMSGMSGPQITVPDKIDVNVNSK